MLDDASLHVMDLARQVNLLLQRSRLICCLPSLQNVKVVIGRVSARVSSGAHRRAENDEVFGDGRMQEEHGTHGIAGIVEDPLVTVVKVGVEVGLGMVFDELIDEGLEEKGGVFR